MVPLGVVPAGPDLPGHLAHVRLEEPRRARPPAVLLRVEAVQVALAPAVVEREAALLEVVKVPGRSS